VVVVPAAAFSDLLFIQAVQDTVDNGHGSLQSDIHQPRGNGLGNVFKVKGLKRQIVVQDWQIKLDD
jgi:hypothetical protein